MNTRKIVTIMVLLTVLVFSAAGMSQAQDQGENDDIGTTHDDGAPPLPDEEIGEAVADPARLLDYVVEPELYVADPEVEPAQLSEELEDTLAAGALSSKIPVQGRLTNASGVPINGNRSIRFALYTASTGGASVCTDTDTVEVTNGLFVAYVDYCQATDIAGQQLYLGIKVGSDPEMTPRQPLYATPYARSLRPGAIIHNTGSGHALTLKTVGQGVNNTALWAENTSATSGIGAWVVANGSDATLISSNRAAGPLFKGFGGDGGEDEVRINNNGSLETKADSYLWIPGSAFIKNTSSDSTRWDVEPGGSVRLWRGGAVGNKGIYFPITLPSVLYGQPVKIERITIYYRCENGTNNYITHTRFTKQTDADSSVDILSTTADRNSNLATSYTHTLTTNNLLSPGQGGLGLYLALNFANDSQYVRIGGIRLQLGHHDLY